MATSPIAMLIELQGVYDGWSIALYEDGTMVNRWANEDGTGPQPGLERRWGAAEEYISVHDGVPDEYYQAATSE
jgi:hypothetical protein